MFSQTRLTSKQESEGSCMCSLTKYAAARLPGSNLIVCVLMIEQFTSLDSIMRALDGDRFAD